jgi:outer membrane murein-binding lipoprotein Lpp
MAPQTLAARVDSLEQRVTRLEELPARVDALTLQVSQLRDEMRSEFSAVCGEIQAGDEETRRTLHEEIRAGDEETRRTLREEIRAGDEETRRTVREEIRAGDERVMEQARVLHEDVVSRLALIQEGVKARGNSRGRRKG